MQLDTNCVTSFQQDCLQFALTLRDTIMGCLYLLYSSTRAIAKVDRVRYFKQVIKTRSKWHVTVGHTTVMAEMMCFSRDASLSDKKSGKGLCGNYEICLNLDV